MNLNEHHSHRGRFTSTVSIIFNYQGKVLPLPSSAQPLGLIAKKLRVNLPILKLTEEKTKLW